jgi:hypothetical protein
MSALGHAYGVSGDKVRAEQVLGRLKELAKQRYVPAYDIAVAYMGIGEKEEAFRWRERAYEEQSAWMVYLNIDPRLDGLHSARRANHAPPAEIAGNLLRPFSRDRR